LPNADTKTRIMDVGETLFAEQGYDATSLRDITGQAGANLAAVNYHFQSKEGLLSAIFQRHVGPVNRQRLAVLDAIEARASERPPKVEELIRAFLAPAFARRRERGADGTRFMQLAGRMHSETNERLRSLLLDQFEEVARRFGKAFSRALPHLARDEVSLRVHFLIGAMAHTLLWSDTMLGFEPRKRRNVEPEEALESLVRFAAAGMTAPVAARSEGGKR